MRIVVAALTTLALLISVKSQHVPYSSNGIIFMSCTQSICWSGPVRGFKCQSGWCKTICTEVTCFENKLSPFVSLPPSFRSLKATAEESFDVQVDRTGRPRSLEGIRTLDMKNLLQLYSRYENCTSDFCIQDDYSGFECKNGFCQIVCKKGNCYKFMIST
ncbi:hypothetical protein Aperf_G00000007448 [Anoplocephala perfoliata]